MPTQNTFNKTVDTLLIMKDAGLVAASAAAQVGGQNKIFDCGPTGTGGPSPTAGMPNAGLFEGELICDISAIETDSSNEKFTIVVQGCNTADFSTGSPPIINLAEHSVGHLTGLGGISNTTSSTGRIVIPFYNWKNGVTYRYLRLYTVVAGTVATGINYTAYIGRD